MENPITKAVKALTKPKVDAPPLVVDSNMTKKLDETNGEWSSAVETFRDYRRRSDEWYTAVESVIEKAEKLPPLISVKNEDLQKSYEQGSALGDEAQALLHRLVWNSDKMGSHMEHLRSIVYALMSKINGHNHLYWLRMQEIDNARSEAGREERELRERLAVLEAEREQRVKLAQQAAPIIDDIAERLQRGEEVPGVDLMTLVNGPKRT